MTPRYIIHRSIANSVCEHICYEYELVDTQSGVVIYTHYSIFSQPPERIQAMQAQYNSRR